MNAIQFIKENGVEKAREVVVGQKDTVAPNLFKYFSPSLNYYHMLNIESNVRISELKRLVESVDLVEHFGNDLIGAKQLLEFSKDCKTIELSGSVITVERLKQAIADYESIFGGEHV